MTENCLKDEHETKADDLSRPIVIGPVEIRNRIFLAPMSGVTDLPFRELALSFGAGLAVTEMVASRELVGNTHESWARLKTTGFRPHMVQLAGRDPETMAEAARIAEANGADIIDINMGCPAKKVIGGLSGSALMREPELAVAIIRATVRAVRVPVTVKMRLGWDHDCLNAPELARAAEGEGARMITVHGRTRMQFYEGRADWAAISRVREAIGLPLVANGDVATRADVAEIIRQSGADAVMVGRSCQGRPWHAGWLAGACEIPDANAVADIFSRHYQAMLAFYGEAHGVRHARKHVGWYLDAHAPGLGPAERASIMVSHDPARVIDCAVTAILRDRRAERSAA